jgi:hypothetical protein
LFKVSENYLLKDDLFSQRLFFRIFLMLAICENKTAGTIKDGNQTKGKYNIAMLGWSKLSF